MNPTQDIFLDAEGCYRFRGDPREVLARFIATAFPNDEGLAFDFAATSHATSERAAGKLGDWTFGQDSAKDGTKNFFILDASGNLLFSIDPTTGAIAAPRGIQGGRTTTLTESSATDICDIAIAAGEMKSGILHYAIEASDGTDHQVRNGMAHFTAVRKGATVTTGIQVIGTEGIAVSAGTLTVTVTNNADTGKFTLRLNAVSSLTQTTLRARWRIESVNTLVTTAV